MPPFFYQQGISSHLSICSEYPHIYPSKAGNILTFVYLKQGISPIPPSIFSEYPHIYLSEYTHSKAENILTLLYLKCSALPCIALYVE